MLWLDAFTANVDRSWRNPNLLLWHGDLWVIDHGASLYFHHGWRSGVTDPAKFAAQPWDVGGHVFEDVRAPRTRARRARSRPGSSRDVFVEVLAQVPDVWLEPVPGAETPDALRAAYVDFLVARLGTRQWLPGGVAMTAPAGLPVRRAALRAAPRARGVPQRRRGAALPGRRLPRRRVARSTPTASRALDPGIDVDQVCDALDLRRRGVPRRRARRARRHGSRWASGSASSRPRAAPCSSPARCTAA